MVFVDGGHRSCFSSFLYCRRYDYSIVGHDGESPLIPFVNFGKPPTKQQERLEVIEKMFWNAMFCASGDHTLAAAEHAVKEVMKQDADDYYVFLLSDANLASYGVSNIENSVNCPIPLLGLQISSKTLAAVLFTEPKVHAYAMFIAGDTNAENLTKGLPPGPHCHHSLSSITIRL